MSKEARYMKEKREIHFAGTFVKKAAAELKACNDNKARLETIEVLRKRATANMRDLEWKEARHGVRRVPSSFWRQVIADYDAETAQLLRGKTNTQTFGI